MSRSIELALIIGLIGAYVLVIDSLENVANQPASSAGKVNEKRKFQEIYARELDKQQKELLGMGFHCKFLFYFTHPMCTNCCHYHEQSPVEDERDKGCACIDSVDSKLEASQIVNEKTSGQGPHLTGQQINSGPVAPPPPPSSGPSSAKSVSGPPGPPPPPPPPGR